MNYAFWSLITKQAVEKVVVWSSLAFYNQFFLVSKQNNKWLAILDLSKLNLFNNTNGNAEMIRLSLQSGNWVTSLYFIDAYFSLMLISHQCLHSHQSKVKKVPQVSQFGLVTAPLKLTKVVKEVKQMVQARGIRIHQYLDDWLTPCRGICFQHPRP